MSGANFVLRTNAPLGEFFAQPNRRWRKSTRDLGIEFSVLTKQIKDSLIRDRLMAALAGTFGLLAGALWQFRACTA